MTTTSIRDEVYAGVKTEHWNWFAKTKHWWREQNLCMWGGNDRRQRRKHADCTLTCCGHPHRVSRTAWWCTQQWMNVHQYQPEAAFPSVYLPLHVQLHIKQQWNQLQEAETTPSACSQEEQEDTEQSGILPAVARDSVEAFNWCILNRTVS